MQEISMNIQDIAQNSVSAGASSISITVDCNINEDLLTIIIRDNGKGMDEDTVQKVSDPFFTTRTTRDVGLGIPLFKMSAEIAGGSFKIESQKGQGTTVTAKFAYSHIDRPPLGAVSETMSQLICLNENIEIEYIYRLNQKEFICTTKEFTAILDGVPLNIPDVMIFIREYIEENMNDLASI